MPGVGDAASDVASQGTSNLKPGLGGGLAVGLGSAFGGQVFGPIVGGIAAGYFLDGQDADTVTQVGMMMGVANAFGGGGSSATGSGGVK